MGNQQAMMRQAQAMMKKMQKAIHWGTTVWNNGQDALGIYDGRTFDYELYTLFHPQCKDANPTREALACGEFRNIGE